MNKKTERRLRRLPDSFVDPELTPAAHFKLWRNFQVPDGINLVEAASLLGLSIDTLSRLCKGRPVTPQTLVTVGDATGIWSWGFEDPALAQLAERLRKSARERAQA